MPRYTQEDMNNAQIATTIQSVLTSLPSRLGIAFPETVTAHVNLVTGEISCEITERSIESPAP